jgi:uncharacterized membrane protein
MEEDQQPPAPTMEGAEDVETSRDMPEQPEAGGQEVLSQPEGDEDLTGVDPNNLMAALSYLAILVLVPLFTKKNDSYTAFHTKQGLVILIGYVVASIAAIWMPAIGNLLFLLLLIASIAGFIQAMRGKRWKIPGIGDIANTFSI